MSIISFFIMNFQNTVVICRKNFFKTLKKNHYAITITSRYQNTITNTITAESRNFKTKKTARIASTAKNLTWFKLFKKMPELRLHFFKKYEHRLTLADRLYVRRLVKLV